MKLNIYLKLYDEITAAFVEVFKKLREEIINGEVDIIPNVFVESRDTVSFDLDYKIADEIKRLIKENPILIKCHNSHIESSNSKEKIEKFGDYAHKLRGYIEDMKYTSHHIDIIPECNTKEYGDILRVVRKLDDVCDKNAINDFMNMMEENDGFKKYSTFIFGTLYTTHCRSFQEVDASVESIFNNTLQYILNREVETDEHVAESKIGEDYISPLLQLDEDEETTECFYYFNPLILNVVAKEAKIIVKASPKSMMSSSNIYARYRITITDIS